MTAGPGWNAGVGAWCCRPVRGGERSTVSLSAAEARKRLEELLKEVAESHEPVQIAGERHSGVLLPEEDWRAIQETLHLTSIPGMRESIAKGLRTPVEECHEELDW